MARPKFTYYIIWKDENGEEQRKDYSAAGGRTYWKEKLLKQFGKQCIVEEGREGLVDDGTGKKVKHVVKEGVPEKPLGPVDEELSIFGLAPKGEKRFVLSNWNTSTRTYTSRLYGGLNDMFKVVEPDGYISIQGQNIIKKTDKETGVRTLTDGRKFTAMGWPIADDVKLFGFSEEEPVVEEEVKQPVKKKAPAKKATSAKPKTKKAPAKRKTTAKKK